MNDQLAEHMGKMTETVLKRVIEKHTQEFGQFREQIEKQVNEMLFNKPVLEVQINDADLKKLTKRACAILPRLITNAKIGLYTLMVGPAGCGKTTAAHQLAEALGLQFGSVCLTAGASETWLFGRQTPTGFVEGMFSKIYREGGVFLADEMDAADANLLLSINTALSHDIMLNPMNGENIKKHKDFIFVAAANTNGKGSTHTYTGRSRLDAATLDRMCIVSIDYDVDLERELCPDKELFDALTEIRSQLKQDKFDEFVSTRAFITAYKSRKAGVTLAEIQASLVGNWSDPAKEISKRVFLNSYPVVKGDPEPQKKNYKTSSKQMVVPVQGKLKWTRDEIPF